MDIDTCVGNFSDAVLDSLAVSTPKRRPHVDPTPQIPGCIQDEIRLINRLRKRWQVTRERALKAEVNGLQRTMNRQLNEWRKDRWSTTLESLNPDDQSLWRMTNG